MYGRQDSVTKGANEGLGAKQKDIIAVGDHVGLEQHRNHFLLRRRHSTIGHQRGMGEGQVLGVGEGEGVGDGVEEGV